MECTLITFLLKFPSTLFLKAWVGALVNVTLLLASIPKQEFHTKFLVMNLLE